MVEKLLHSIKSDKPCGVDNFDGRLLRLAVKSIQEPICHIINLIIENGIYPQPTKQIQCYFEENNTNSESQHACKVGYSMGIA